MAHLDANKDGKAGESWTVSHRTLAAVAKKTADLPKCELLRMGEIQFALPKKPYSDSPP